jgi:DNA invertase Pin-like site-specific DNA recombinase
MMQTQSSSKIKPHHLQRKAVVYMRQSTERQVRENLESQRLQRDLQSLARELGWRRVEVLDHDLGSSASLGAKRREDFDRLVGSVALGEVGIIMSREVSRLSRTDKDWCHLLEVCRVFDTLLAESDHVYDLSQMDDQLVLGIKGTMSVVELNVLKQRMQMGMEAKARRGELFRMLAAGYAYDGMGKVVLHPDERIRRIVALVFAKFRETSSLRQTCLWFHHESIEVPVNKFVRGQVCIGWQLPTQSFISDVLHNPFYAGAYTYGRRPCQTVMKEGRLVKRQGRVQRAADCRVFIPGHHEGYIDWATYEENQSRMRHNRHGFEADKSVASIRSGQGLLASILRCGRCGRRLHVHYWGARGTSPRYLCRGEFDTGGKHCLGFGGSVDRKFSDELLAVISPLGVRASLQALDQCCQSDDERRTALRLQLKQAEYEAARAFEQYDEVDPRNRLVATDLEARWNKKLEEVDKLKASLAELDADVQTATPEERAAILALGEQFEQVWHSERCPVELKKKILRTVVEEVIVDLDDATQMLSFVIHWKGGSHTRLQMPRPRGGVGQKTADEDLEIIRKMAVRYGDAEIANVLNRLGRHTGKGKRWNQERVSSARQKNSIHGQSCTLIDPAVLNMNESARHCGVSDTTIRRLVEAGVLPMKQVAPWAPWEILRSDLESEPVRKTLDHLRATGKLVLGGDRLAGQPSLPFGNHGTDNARYSS